MKNPYTERYRGFFMSEKNLLIDLYFRKWYNWGCEY